MESRIVQLARKILANTGEVDSYLRTNNLPQPSFEVDGPVDFGAALGSAQQARLSTIEASMELQDLLLGPTMILRPMVRRVDIHQPSTHESLLVQY